jgi:mRNA interferase RelE/StbE
VTWWSSASTSEWGSREFIRGALADDPHGVGKPLRDELIGRYSAGRGEFRVIYEINDDTIVVRVIDVRHRRDVYS